MAMNVFVPCHAILLPEYLAHGLFSSIMDFQFGVSILCRHFGIHIFSRESEGSFAYGNYWREAEDLRSVIEHFIGANRVISAILGHSKGVDDWAPLA
uniref:Uncharacterized protein MANES_16G101100 n=1 Tax=Rhizophora mucronata TaxID=61149 RepID=A0A2P2KPV3_RHIMU